VKVPDVNLLLYGLDESSPQYERVAPWLEAVLSGNEPVGFAWSVLIGVVRIATKPLVFGRPFEPAEVLDVIDGWLALPCAVVLHPTERHSAILRGLLEPLGAAGNLTSDAHLAAIAIEHGGEVCSADTDFARFRGLRWMNPLA
jgi:toxin-antitoxin system PIN domain toxin